MAKKNRKQVIKPVEDSLSYDVNVEEQHVNETLKTHPSVSISESETENQVAVAKATKNKVLASVEEKPKVCQKLFTDDDEIRVLQGIIYFKSEFGKLPFSSEEKTSIYERVKSSISFEVTCEQFMEKMKSFKRKFIGQLEKKSFAKAHDQKIFDLSTTIWKRDVESTAAKSRKMTKRKVKEEDGDVLLIGNDDQDWFQMSYLVGSVANTGLGEKSVMEKWSFMPKKKKQKLEQRWIALHLDGLGFMLRKTELVREVTSAIAEALNL